MAESNSSILGTLWLNATNDFQQRVPNPTIAGIDRTIQTLMDPMNGDLWNQFVDTLVKRIGMVKVRNQSFQNPLRGFKSENMLYGNTIQEIAPRWIKAHAYSQDSTLLDVTKPEAQEWFHSVNRQDTYPISINDIEIRKSFTDDYGLNSIITGFLAAPINADEYDEYRIMLELMAYYDKHWGFFTVNLENDPYSELGGKEILRNIKALTAKMRIPSPRYNASVIDIPVFVSDPGELILLIDPNVEAGLEVDVLASIFHVELADIDVRRIVVDEFPIHDAVALLTTRDWWVCHDTVKQMGSFYDPSNMTTNYYYQRQGIYSVSPFVPAILFTYERESTAVPTVTMTPSGLKLDPSTGEVKPGETLQLNPQLEGELTGADGFDVEMRPDAVTYRLSADCDLSPETYVDDRNLFHLQRRGLEGGETITVTATSSYLNPSGDTTPYTATATITVGTPE